MGIGDRMAEWPCYKDRMEFLLQERLGMMSFEIYEIKMGLGFDRVFL